VKTFFGIEGPSTAFVALSYHEPNGWCGAQAAGMDVGNQRDLSYYFLLLVIAVGRQGW